MKQIIDFINKKNLDIDKEKIQLENNESLSFYLYYKFINQDSSMVIVCNNMLTCQNLYNSLSKTNLDNIYIYAVDEINKFTSLVSSPELELSRIFVLNTLIENNKSLILTTTLGIKRLVPKKKLFESKIINLKTNDEYDYQNVVSELINIGYKKVFKVSQPFEFSIRGGIIDIYSINYKLPIRIEFFDTVIDSIRFFDTDSQRTTSIINSCKIVPSTEFIVDNLDEGIKVIKNALDIKKKEATNNIDLISTINDDILHIQNKDYNDALYRYYGAFNCYDNFASYLDNTKVYFLNSNEILDAENFIENEYVEEIASNNSLLLPSIPLYNSLSSFKSNVDNIRYLSTDISNDKVDINYLAIESFDFNFGNLYSKLIQLLSENYTIYIGLDNEMHYNSLISFFENNKQRYIEINNKDNLKKGYINVSHVDYDIGLDFVSDKLYVLGEKEIFSKRFVSKISQFSRYKDAITIESVSEIEPGDYLVHEHYGIGIYKGIETMLTNNIHREYLKIEYKNEDLLYVPLEQFKLVRKYLSKEGVCPKINKLGSKDFEKTKAKIKERVNEIASKLISLYSSRILKEGFCFAKDDDLQKSFESDFGYTLTNDQLKAVDDIKKDMESNSIMDRLLVGDVGFGKTEIAMIAAFKAINSGKQVALLCPTTLLARQHYYTALERFRNFGVRIAMLSRLISDSETNRILNNLKDGKIDFIIGTHRILSEDVKFKDLGLLIIDEEHKFGVEHKEKIKEIKENIDVLSLSATPIPRTLQMALTGIRGFSSINTPINNRMPVQTYVIKKDNVAIKEIIDRELARNGQVYYLSNRIDKLNEIKIKIESLCKMARVAIIHGKLNIDDQEEIMSDFVSNKYNVLLCTTIIENGIDIPNANTIIVENADCFGISSLYQIKGRVGRSNRLAYAYLMYQPQKQLSEIATKRLQAIKEFTSLGSGYKIAMKDLLTRGAGDMLGVEQSGFIESVGIDMYIEMLNNAIAKQKALLKNEDFTSFVEKEVKVNKVVNVDAYIPKSYFDNDYERIELYKKIDTIDSPSNLYELKQELIDQTGKLPLPIERMFLKKELDLYVDGIIYDNYDEFEKNIVIQIAKSILNYKQIGIKLFEIASNVSNKISLKFYNNRINAEIVKDNSWLENSITLAKKIKEHLDSI